MLATAAVFLFVACSKSKKLSSNRKGRGQYTPPSALVTKKQGSDRDREELINLYKTIVKRKDNQWYLHWARDLPEEDAFPDWSNQVCWLFMFLDRLREGGLMAQVRGKARRTVLRYWDDYLLGAPYENDEFDP